MNWHVYHRKAARSLHFLLYLLLLAGCTNLMASGSGVSKKISALIYDDSKAMATDTIGNNLRDEYLREVAVDVLNLSKGKVGEILEKFSVWNWIIKEDELSENINASTTFKNGVVTTTLNRKALDKATKLSVARTIIHEMLHAYLTLHFQNESSLAILNYPGMMKSWLAAKKPNLNEIQHDEIKRSFITEIASALMEYDQVSGSKPDDDSLYFDLSWGGLDFAGHNTLTTNDKRRIQQRLIAEQFSL